MIDKIIKIFGKQDKNCGSFVTVTSFVTSFELSTERLFLTVLGILLQSKLSWIYIEFKAQ